MIISKAEEGATEETKVIFIEKLAETLMEQNNFPERKDMPILTKLRGKSERSPAMDQVAQKKLKVVKPTRIGIQYELKLERAERAQNDT